MNQIATAVRAMRESGLSYDDVLRLMWLKYQVSVGKRSELTVDDKRLRFVRYLYVHGHISR